MLGGLTAPDYGKECYAQRKIPASLESIELLRIGFKGLWPKTLEGEALAIQWSFSVMTEVEKPTLVVLFHRVFLPEDQRDRKVAEDGEQQLQGPLRVLDQALAKTGHLIGSTLTVADLNVALVLAWAKIGRANLSAYPHVEKWLIAAMLRPAAVKAAPRRG